MSLGCCLDRKRTKYPNRWVGVRRQRTCLASISYIVLKSFLFPTFSVEGVGPYDIWDFGLVCPSKDRVLGHETSCPNGFGPAQLDSGKIAHGDVWVVEGGLVDWFRCHWRRASKTSPLWKEILQLRSRNGSMLRLVNCRKSPCTKHYDVGVVMDFGDFQVSLG